MPESSIDSSASAGTITNSGESSDSRPRCGRSEPGSRGFMQTLLQDLRYGARLLLEKPGFTLIAVITLALGISANTVIFGAFNAVMLRPLPYSDPGKIVTVWDSFPQLGVKKIGVTYA